MKIQVYFDDYTVGTYASVKEAKEAILDNFAEGVNPDRVVEIDDRGDETGKVWGCVWNLTLEEQEDV